MDGSARTYRVVNLGCKVNRVESDAIEDKLARSGFARAEGPADVVVVNTCTVTADAEKKTRKAVRRALRENPAAHVVVTGCSVAIDRAGFEAMGDAVRAVDRADIEDALDAIATDAIDGHGDQMAEPHQLSRVRRGIKVQDGCDNACTFCIVHVARGRSRSRSADEVLAEAARLIGAGVPEIVLTGIDLGAYRDGSTDLESLIARMLCELPLFDDAGSLVARLRLSSIEPQNMTEGLARLMAGSGGALCRHLHLPLQSGSDRILRSMARRYGAASFREAVGILKRDVPGMSISTDVIVGFPGEDDADLEKTAELCREAGFSKTHVFPYSIRTGTPAAAMDGQIPHAVKEERARLLRALSDELRAADLASRAGTQELAVVEVPGRAMTESYHEVAVPLGLDPGRIFAYAHPSSAPSLPHQG